MKTKLMMVLLITLISSCKDYKNKKWTYVDSSIGYLSYKYFNCEVDLVITNEGVNLFDKDGNVVTCSGYVKMTEKERDLKNNPDN